VEEGNLVYNEKKIYVLDSVGKDPNRWLKVAIGELSNLQLQAA
jgi:hypothetical protein